MWQDSHTPGRLKLFHLYSGTRHTTPFQWAEYEKYHMLATQTQICVKEVLDVFIEFAGNSWAGIISRLRCLRQETATTFLFTLRSAYEI